MWSDDAMSRATCVCDSPVVHCTYDRTKPRSTVLRMFQCENRRNVLPKCPYSNVRDGASASRSCRISAKVVCVAKSVCKVTLR